MQEWLVAGGVGFSLVLTGILMMRAHRQAWKRSHAKFDEAISDSEMDLETATDPRDKAAIEELYRERARYRRRMQTSGILVLIGILIPVGMVVIPWEELEDKRAAWLFAFYWGGVLLLATWIMLMGIGDFFASAHQTRSQLAQIRVHQRQLEQELSRLKASRSSTTPGELKD